MRNRTVFDIDMQVRFRKWWELLQGKKVLVEQEDYEWLKDQASKVVGLKNDIDRLRKENARLNQLLKDLSSEKRKGWSEANRQEKRYRLAMMILDEHGLAAEFWRREMKGREERQEEVLNT